MPSKTPREISGYTVLPIQLPPQPAFATAATHYLYVRPHEPKLPDPDASRSLFLVNIPIATTEYHIRDLFANSLSAGRVERIEFQDSAKPTSSSSSTSTSTTTLTSKKRKRETIQDFETALAESTLPETWDRQLRASGAHAVVVFLDRPSMETSLKAAKRAAKNHTPVPWGSVVDDKVPSLGPSRYLTHHQLQYPPKRDLLRAVNSYMANYTRLEEARAKEDARRASEPDEDGFVTVTKGIKAANPARQEEMKELVEKQREKQKGLEDFYRFQTREKRKERQGELVRKFEEDRRRVEEMRRRRGKIRPE